MCKIWAALPCRKIKRLGLQSKAQKSPVQVEREEDSFGAFFVGRIVFWVLTNPNPTRFRKCAQLKLQLNIFVQ